MLRREAMRISVMAMLGFMVALTCYLSGMEKDWGIFLFAMAYCIGIFYAGQTLLRMAGGILRYYFRYQAFSLIMRPLWGTFLCVLLLIVGFAVILSFGWMIGLVKCVVALYRAREIDRECEEYRMY